MTNELNQTNSNKIGVFGNLKNKIVRVVADREFGLSLDDFARLMLFSPLGLRSDIDWLRDDSGEEIVLITSPRDMVKQICEHTQVLQFLPIEKKTRQRKIFERKKGGTHPHSDTHTHSDTNIPLSPQRFFCAVELQKRGTSSLFFFLPLLFFFSLPLIWFY